MSDPNLFEPEWEPGTPPRFQGVRLAAAAGATEIGATLYELDPGSVVSPYHVHHGNEELLFVIAGRPSVRTPDGTRELETGAVVAFPRGPDGAHQVLNASDAPARVLLVSTMNVPEVAEYPDTGALLAMTAPGAGRTFAAEGERPLPELLEEAIQRGTSTS